MRAFQRATRFATSGRFLSTPVDSSEQVFALAGQHLEPTIAIAPNMSHPVVTDHDFDFELANEQRGRRADSLGMSKIRGSAKGYRSRWRDGLRLPKRPRRSRYPDRPLIQPNGFPLAGNLGNHTRSIGLSRVIDLVQPPRELRDGVRAILELSGKEEAALGELYKAFDRPFLLALAGRTTNSRR